MEAGKTYYVPVEDYKNIVVGGNKLKYLKAELENGLEIGACLKISTDGSDYQVLKRCAKLSDVTYG